MFHHLKLIVPLLFVFLVACVGEGKPRKASLSLSTNDITLEMPAGSTASQDVEVSFKGDRLIVTTPPEVGGLPSWLSIKDKEGSTESATFELTINAPESDGVYSAIVRFVTGFEYSEGFAYQDVLITITTIAPIKLYVDADYGQKNLPSAKDITFIDTELKSGSLSTVLYKNNSIKNWLAVNENIDGYTFSILTTNLAAGLYQADVTFESPESEKIVVRVEYTIRDSIISFSNISDVTVKDTTPLENLSFTSSMNVSTGSFDWEVSDYSPKITVVQGQNLDGLLISVNHHDLRNYSNGIYQQWINIRYKLPNDTQYRIKKITFDLLLELSDELAIQFTDAPNITVNNSTTDDELIIPLNIKEGGYYLTWDITDSSELISVQKNLAADGMIISIDENGLNRSRNGLYEQAVDILYSVPFSSQLRTTRIAFDLTMDMINITSISPKVIYSGSDLAIRVWGENLNDLTDEQLLLASENFKTVTHISESEVELTLWPTTENGEYEVFIDNSLGLEYSKSKLIVKPAPSFPVAEVTLPSRAQNVAYDAAREAFYFTSYSDNAVYRIEHDEASWTWSSFGVNNPTSYALEIDGGKLIVGNSDCEIHEIELAEGTVTKTRFKPNCFSTDSYSFVGQFYTGLTIIADSSATGAVNSYPKWGEVPFTMPRMHSPLGVVSQYNTHMIWAELPVTSGQLKAYVYNVRSNTLNSWGTVAGDYYRESLFSISAKGERLSHFNDIYNNQLNHIGSLGDLEQSSVDRTAISPDGTRAVMFTFSDKKVNVFDISVNSAPFPKLGSEIDLNGKDLMVDRIVLSEDNDYLFVFTYDHKTNISKMQVFNLQLYRT